MEAQTRLTKDGEDRITQINYWTGKLEKIFDKFVPDNESRKSALTSLNNARLHAVAAVTKECSEPVEQTEEGQE